MSSGRMVVELIVLAATAGGLLIGTAGLSTGQTLCPANIETSNSPGQCGAELGFGVSCPGCCTLTCVPPSDSFFSVGVTTVECTCTDSTGMCSFTVAVNDQEPPTIVCPPDIVRTVEPGAASGTVNFAATTSDNCPVVGQIPYTCSPPSGSQFPLGTTDVTCTATDASNNSATCSFTVTLWDPSRAAPTMGTPALAGLVLVLGAVGAWLLARTSTEH